tara:strand:- start:437 stop:661 length:225 start_codon:yes stop_codon:yes gene_type:complete
MPQATASLNKIGTSVIVNLDKVRDRIPSRLLDQLSKNPRGQVIDYKMNDANGIGLVLKLGDGSTSWFFEDEIKR